MKNTLLIIISIFILSSCKLDKPESDLTPDKPINNPPTISVSTNTIIIDEDDSASFVVTISDRDDDNLTLKFKNPANGNVSCQDNNCTYIPSANYNGEDSVEVAVSDGKTISEYEKINISINPINDAPAIIANKEIPLFRYQTNNIDLHDYFSDPENDPLTFNFQNNTLNTVIDNGSGLLDITLDDNATNSDKLESVNASDNEFTTSDSDINFFIYPRWEKTTPSQFPIDIYVGSYFEDNWKSDIEAAVLAFENSLCKKENISDCTTGKLFNIVYDREDDDYDNIIGCSIGGVSNGLCDDKIRIYKKTNWFSDYTYNGKIAITVSNINTRRFLQKSDIIFNFDENFSSGQVSGSYDFQSILIHELGHVVGLQHSNESNSIMYAYYRTNYIRREFNSNDLDTVQKNYIELIEL